MILKKYNIGGHSQPDIKTYYKLQWLKYLVLVKRQEDQWKKPKSPETDLHILWIDLWQKGYSNAVS